MADTALRIIRSVDERCPNQISEQEKGRMLARLELTLWDRIFARHAGAAEIHLFQYKPGMDLNTAEMAVPEPYSQLYDYGLEMLIHETNGDIERYNNARILYLDAYNDFSKFWTRTHMPLENPRFRL